MSNFCQEFFYFITFFRPGSDRKLNNTNIFPNNLPLLIYKSILLFVVVF